MNKKTLFCVGFGSALFLCSLTVLHAAQSIVGNTTLKAFIGEPHNSFGVSVDISPSGQSALIGASYEGSSVKSGIAYIYSSLSSSAVQELIPFDSTPGDDFGGSVALSDDGSTAIIGSPDALVGDNRFQGAVYIFTKNSGWSQEAKLTAPDGSVEGTFGCSVDIADNGNTVVIGSCSTPMGGQQPSAYVYIRQNGEWNFQQQFRGNDTRPDDSFGKAVALSGDGNTILVGAFMASAPTNDQGAAYVFTRNGSLWKQQAKLTAADGTIYGMFGNSVDLSNDGNTALVGASWSDAVYVFGRTGISWSQQIKIGSPDGSGNDRFGESVSLSNNGSILTIGAQFSRQAYLYVQDGSAWNLQQQLSPSNSESYGYGKAVAVSDDGRSVLVGAPEMTNEGVVYVFRPFLSLNAPNFLLLKPTP
jgi:hypothetical protein